MKIIHALAAGAALSFPALTAAHADCAEDIAAFSEEIGVNASELEDTAAEPGDAPDPADPANSTADDTEAAQAGLTTAPGMEMDGAEDPELGSTATVLTKLSEARSHSAQDDEEACMAALEEAEQLHEAAPS